MKCINMHKYVQENIGLWAKSAMGEFILELNDLEPYPKWLQEAITIYKWIGAVSENEGRNLYGHI